MLILLKKGLAKVRYPFNANERRYFLNDPWHMERPSEQYRFKETNRIIQDNIGPVKTIVEIGSATGEQTKWLLKLGKIHGIEVSKQAVKRACKNVPEAIFEVGGLPTLPSISSDLVTALEVFTYVPVSDIPAAIRALERIAPKRMVSYHQSKVPSKVQGKLDPFFSFIPNVQSTEIEFEDEKWTVLWW